MAVGSKEGLALLQDPDMWVMWPVMPVKRYPKGHQMVSGLVVDDGALRSGKPVVYEKNMFELVTGPIHEQLEGSPKHEYDSLEAMLDDGWMVD